MKQTDFKIQIETQSLLIIAYPERNVVIFTSKYGAFNYILTCNEFCDILNKLNK